MISICGNDLRVYRETAGGAGVCVAMHDLMQVLQVEHSVLMELLQRVSLEPYLECGQEMLNETCLLFVVMQLLPEQLAEVSSAIKACVADGSDDEEDVTPTRTVIKLKSRRVDVEQGEIEITLPRHFSRQQFTKQYALREYDIGPQLQRDLASLEEFWSKPFCSARQGKSVASTTFAKRRERILCFLGFLVMYRCLEDRDQLTLLLYGEWRAFESYLCYLKEVRMLSAATISESLTAAVFVSKWLCREMDDPGRNFANAELVCRYRDWRNQQASMAIRERKDETWDELREQGRWLHWHEYCAATQRMKDKFESSQSPKALYDALLLAMFQALPARSGEVRLLEYMSEEDVRAAKGNRMTFRQFAEREKLNLLTKRDGKWTMFLSQYKTFRYQGVDVTEFDSQLLHADLVRLLELWLLEHRPAVLVGAGVEQHRFVFMTRGGKPFGESYFSEFLARLICKLTGQSVGANLLRSSFVSYFYSESNPSEEATSPAVRDSVAKAMRHSVREAERTYDRRTPLEKKRKGIEMISRANPLEARMNVH